MNFYILPPFSSLNKMIKIFKTIKYKNIKIIFRQIDNLFEYLVPFRNNIYSKHIIVKYKWWKVLHKEKYNKKEIQAILITLQTSAQDTIKLLTKK